MSARVLELLPPFVLATEALVVGAALLARRRAVASAAALLAVGVLLVVASSLADAERAWILLGVVAAPLSVVLFPDGRWQHPFDFSVLATVVAAGGLAALVPGSIDAMALVVLLATAGHVWWSLAQHPEHRRAITWLAVSAVPGLLFFGVAGMVLPHEAGSLAVIGLLPVPLAMYLGATSPYLVDVRAAAVPVVSHAAVLMAYLAVFVGVAAPLGEGLGPDFPDSALIPVLGLVGAVLAAAYHPSQLALRRVVEELVLGARQDPLAAAGLVTTRIGEDVQDALRALREVLVLPFAAIVEDGRATATSGTPTAHEVSLPLGDGLGDLVVGLRDDEVRLGRTEQRVLSLAIPLLAQTMRATRLSTQLRESRGQTITAREEERRRLRRDLHDGLGPQLTGIALTADAATNLAGRDPDTSRRLLQELRAETTRAIESVRGLVYGMRPAALDELGLAGAIAQMAGALRLADGEGLAVEVSAGELTDLPAATEVAAYRIVAEALTNVARHTGATSATVSLRLSDGALVVQVDDQGGAGGPWRPGVGLASMRERAEELGGRLVAGPSDHGGRVRAQLPLPTSY